MGRRVVDPWKKKSVKGEKILFGFMNGVGKVGKALTSNSSENKKLEPPNESYAERRAKMTESEKRFEDRCGIAFLIFVFIICGFILVKCT